MTQRVWGLAWLVLSVGCSSAERALEAPQPNDAAAPVAAKGGEVVYETGLMSTKPGTEAMFCHYLSTLDRDLLVTGFNTRQAPGGHHMVVYRALEPKPEGTVEDCSTGESMSNLMLVLTQTGTQEPGASAIDFPEGHVVVLSAGTQLVAQSHYINTTDHDIEAMDRLTINTTSAELSSLTQLHLLVAAQVSFKIPPRAEYSASAGCQLEQPISLLSLAPHMHEWGSHIEVQLGHEKEAPPIMAVQGWTAEMRDSPPVTPFGDDAEARHGQFDAGMRLRLTCTWRNTEDHALEFPSEMCSAVGYFTSDAPDAADILCVGPAD